MYTEEPRREINWGSIIKKGLLILLIAGIIFLLIWLFTRNTSNGINVNYEGNNNNSINSNTYSEIFIDNYRYFHDTAKEYYLISELPENGKTLKFTLQELINRQLIIPFSYTNKDNCDTEASYVSVKNDNGKYTMTTTLVCGNEVATTKEELGCNQLCNGTSCETTEIEYQFKQPYETTETTYTCPSGYTKTGSGENTKCVKTDKDTINASKTTTYTCPKGYTKTGSGENTKCVTDNAKTISATKNVSYTCPSGYKKSGSGENTKCYKYSEDKVNADYKYTYSCPSGYTKNGTSCTKTISATANTTYSCPSDYTKNGTKCSKTETINATANTTYSCPSGYTKNGSKCSKTETVSASSNTTYSCPSGYTKNGTSCTKTTTKDATSNISYYCPSGYDKEGNTCIKYLYTDFSYGSTYQGCTGGQLVNSGCSGSGCSSSKYVYKCTKGVSSATTYSCPSGYTKNGTTCTKTETISATPSTTYSCPSGYTKNGSSCTKTTTKDASVNTTYSCPSGYTKNDTKCSKTTTKDATSNTTYTCSAGYTLSGKNCVKTTNADKEKVYYCSDSDYALDGKYCYAVTKTTKSPTKETTYSCPSGYTKSGSGSNTKCSIGETIKAYKGVTYSCPSGYTKSGIGSNSICTKGNTTSVNPTKSSKTVTKYRYKWSTKTSIDGWIRTGETRQVKASSK